MVLAATILGAPSGLPSATKLLGKQPHGGGANGRIAQLDKADGILGLVIALARVALWPKVKLA